jgi:hypothetical protein
MWAIFGGVKHARAGHKSQVKVKSSLAHHVLRRVHPPTAQTHFPPKQKIDFSLTVYNTNN